MPSRLVTVSIAAALLLAPIQSTAQGRRGSGGGFVGNSPADRVRPDTTESRKDRTLESIFRDKSSGSASTQDNKDIPTNVIGPRCDCSKDPNCAAYEPHCQPTR
jgi:hypothetical protein